MNIRMQIWEEEDYDIEACTRTSSSSRLLIPSSSSSSPSSSLQRNGSLICGVQFSFIDSFSRKNLSSDKFAAEPLRLTILKLDGTFFEIEVLRNGTVAELKRAVEASFSHLPKKGAGMVSWSHVWGHFCLYYNGQKLLSDNDYLGSYGIKDGDQLQFIRHVSINYNTTRMSSEKEESYPDEPTTSHGYGDSQLNGVEYQCHEEDIEHQRSGNDNDYNADTKEDKSLMRSCEYRLARLFRGLFSYQKLTSLDTRIEQRSNSSKFSDNLLGSFSNVLRLSYTNEYGSSQRETWKGK